MSSNKHTKRTTQDQLIEGAKEYAAYDRSDPFALNRALAHIRVGIASFKPTNNRDSNAPIPSFGATESKEERYLDPGMYFSDGGNKYTITVYRNAHRP